MMEKVTFRYAERKDVPLILEFIRGLAEHEGMPGLVTATEELLEEWLFDKQKAEVLFLEVSGAEAGFALFFSSLAAYPDMVPERRCLSGWRRLRWKGAV